MIFGSCHFLFHQFTQRDEPNQVIADMNALTAFSRFPIYTLTKNADILALIVFGCIIFTIVQHTWNSMAILIVMEVFLVLITAGTGVIEGVLQWPVRAWTFS